MNAALDTALQAFGLRKVAATSLDLKLLTDPLGRTLPIGGGGQLVNSGPAAWLGAGGGNPAEYGYGNHGTAFSIISYILDAAAPIPWGAYLLDKADNRAKPAPPDHAFSELVYRPNPHQSWAEFKRLCEGSYEVSGECFIRRVRPPVRSRNRGGKTAELWCLAGKVDVLPLGGLGQFDTPTGYRHYDPLNGTFTDYAYDEVLHLKTWNPTNPHRGLSPIQAGADAMTAAKSGLESRVRQYQNQGPPGIIYDDRDETKNEPLSPEQASGIQRWFDSFRPGRRREGNVPVIGGKLGYLTLGMSQVDLDVLAAIPYDKDAVADLFHFPGQLLNGSKGTTFSNMGEAGAALYSRCVIPLETVLRDGLNRWLGPEYEDGVYLDFDVSHIPELQPNKEKLAAWLNSCPYITSQDKQRIMGVPVDENFPKYLIQSTYVTLEDLMNTAAGDDAAAGTGDLIN